jgi:hypothetical protein
MIRGFMDGGPNWTRTSDPYLVEVEMKPYNTGFSRFGHPQLVDIGG